MNQKLKLFAAVLASSALVAGTASAAGSPTVSTGSTSSVTTSSVQLHGSVNPNGAKTSYQFQWGLTTAYGLSSGSKTATGTKATAVKTTASHLLPGTVYHYRLIAVNKFGAAIGTDHKFKTAGTAPPEAATGPASQVTTHSATVSALINPHGAKTSYLFQYGLTTAYGVQTFAGTVPAGSPPLAVTQSLNGLQPGTLFHYRVVAYRGSSVIATGNDATFITEPSPRPVPKVRTSVKPHRDRHRPFVFTTSGKVQGPSRFPATLECTGNVTVRFKLGKRTVASDLVPLRSDCGFSTQTTFRHMPGRGKRPRSEKLTVSVRFGGNGYLAAASSRPVTVTLG